MKRSSALVEKYVHDYFGITGSIRPLVGEVDANFHLQTDTNTAYTIKVSRPNFQVNELDFQASMMKHLADKDLPFATPKVVSSLDKKDWVTITNDAGESCALRLQTWITGRVLGEVNPRSNSVLQQWGKISGTLSQHLQGFDHLVAHRFYKWNPSETLKSRSLSKYFQTIEEQEIANHFWQVFENQVLPLLPSLRCSVNHNDIHEFNLLVNYDYLNPKIVGLIDFGDAIYTQTINELAIACAYAAMDLPDPLSAIEAVLRGYHEVFPVKEKELEVLFPLIAARLLITVTNAAQNIHLEPDNEYLQISARPAWELLKKLKTISPTLAHYRFRHICGLEACPKRLVFDKWLAKNTNEWAEVIQCQGRSIMSFDLSVGSLDLGNNSNFLTKKFERLIQNLLAENNATIGIGGYNETRPFYTTDAYQVPSNNGPIWRTVHLGLDFWTDAETPVFSPLAGQIHSFQNNAADCDYGPTIIIEHQATPELTFYTLYGHLTLDSLEGLEIGMPIKKGQQIAKIGAPPINGNWAPHLHFQIILDLLEKKGDFPGVAFPHEAAIWLSFCPPLPTLKTLLSFTQNPNNQYINTYNILQKRKQHLGKNLSVSYQNPLQIVRGFKQYLYDQNGRRYLDTANNVAHVGHEHPRVVKAAQQQIGVLNTNTRYLHPEIVQYAEELLATFPVELEVLYLVNSGSEANELALRMAQTYSGQKDIIAIEVGYHGNTGNCIDVSSYKFDGTGGKGAPPNTHIVPIPDTYRGIYKDPNTAGQHYANYVNKVIKKVQSEGRNIAGFIGESILSCGGQIVLPQGYLKSIYQQVRAAGGLCIADEVQVGFGRVGSHFWGFELQEVVPDIVTMGKPIGNGHPLAAVATTRKVAAAFTNGMEYFNTFGGNPVACVIGRTVLQVIKEEHLQQNALAVGEYLLENLHELQNQFPIIGDIRGHGLFLGLEVVKDHNNLIPATAQTTYLVNRMREKGVLMSSDGPLNNVIKIKPPLCFTKANVDFLIREMSTVFREDFMKFF